MSNLEKIKTLREATGLSLGVIQRALAEAKGDQAVAEELLQSQSAALAGKKTDRVIKEGAVAAYLHGNKKLAALVALGSETDFVARSDEFQSLAYDLAMQVASMNPATVEELLGQAFIKQPELTVADWVNQHIAKWGENIKIGDFIRLAI